MVHTHRLPHIAITRRTKTRTPGNFQKAIFIRKSGSIGYFRLVFELGCVVEQAARHRPIKLKDRVRCPVSPCEIWGGAKWHWTKVFLRVLRFFPCQYHSISATYINLPVLARTFKKAMPSRKSQNIYCFLSVFESLIMYRWDKFWKTQIFSKARIHLYIKWTLYRTDIKFASEFRSRILQKIALKFLK
jgi:hypothetical protein